MVSPVPRWWVVTLILASVALGQKGGSLPQGWAVLQDGPLRFRATMPVGFKRVDSPEASTWLAMTDDGVVYSLLTTELKGQGTSPAAIEANLLELSAGHYAHSKCKGTLVPGTARKDFKDGVARVAWVAQCSDGKMMAAKLSHQRGRYWMMSGLIPKDMGPPEPMKAWLESLSVEK